MTKNPFGLWKNSLLGWRLRTILLCIGLSCLTTSALLLYCPLPVLKSGATMPRLFSFDFEVFGRVQGVFFRKHTQQEARRLGVVGWCRNTRHDTVDGQAQGAPDALAAMKRWLRDVGSPHSKIDRAEFRNEREVAKLSFQGFSIKH